VGALATIDYEAERELLGEALRALPASLEFGFATAEALREAAGGGRFAALHFSGHSNGAMLSAEDGFGGVHPLPADTVCELLAPRGGGGGGALRLVFLSACSSAPIGAALAAAGVAHVVAVEGGQEVEDAAAATFARVFYLALARGAAVRAAFGEAVRAVRASPAVRAGVAESHKFVLLPEGAPHDEILFPPDAAPRALPPPPPPPPPAHRAASSSSSPPPRGALLPPPPESFVGRKVDVYNVLLRVAKRRLVSLCGGAGVGKSVLAAAVARYIAERRLFGLDAAFVDAGRARSAAAVLARAEHALSAAARRAGLRGAAEGEARVLLLLDGLDALASDAEQRGELLAAVETLLERHAGLKLLLTLHAPLCGDDAAAAAALPAMEVAYEVPPLAPLDAARVLLRCAPRALSLREVLERGGGGEAGAAPSLLAALSAHPVTLSCGGNPRALVRVAAALGTCRLPQLLDAARTPPA
jgi:hypothetical protein